MRVGVFRDGANAEQVGFFTDDGIVDAAQAFAAAEETLPQGAAHELILSFLACGDNHNAALAAAEAAEDLEAAPLAEKAIRSPIQAPAKLFLLAGNYAAHIEEGGGLAVERARTFPYVFMKPWTTINHHEAEVVLPKLSPSHIDWECELGVIIGKRCRRVSEAEALDYVAGFTVVNDISDRKFRPNSDREERPKDQFFDWLHGKWHDGSCPIGPCVLSRDACVDPQALGLTTRVNGEVMQDASTSLQVFPVAAIVEFISSFTTLEPGDLISTGTPSGVGNARGIWLRDGDVVETSIEEIGTLRNHIVEEI